MRTPRFLQIHTLQSYSGTLLNRDDAGLAKRLPFGGAIRTRVSSQCLKRHWRTAKDDWSLTQIGVPMAVRSRHIVNRRVYQPLIDAGIDPSIAECIAEAFLKALFQESAKRTQGESEENEASAFNVQTAQAVMFGQPEIEYLAQEALGLAKDSETADAAKKNVTNFFKDKDVKANIGAMKHHAGLESALFGRFVTSDLISNTDASIHVAHAFTVHEEESESDYFTVVDDLVTGESDSGSAGIFDQELTSGLYYGYVVVDVPLLVSNLEGGEEKDWLGDESDRTVSSKVVEHLCHLIAKVSPGAKLGSTAPYGFADLMLVEAGSRQPRSLANAFRTPVPLHNTKTLNATLDQLASYQKKDR